MSWFLGLGLGLGLVLVASPWLWPKRPSRQDSRIQAAIRDRMAAAGLGDIPLIGVMLGGALTGTVVAGTVLAITGIVALGAAAFLVGAMTPIAAIAWRARRHRRIRSMLWPEIVDHIVAGVRSGLALPDALASLAESGPVPTRAIFAAFAADHRATGSFSYAIDRLKARLADPTADRLLETLRMAREVGGSEVTSVLRQLALYLRSDQALRGELEARQSWITNAARLGVAAPWVTLLILSTRPEAAVAYNSAGGIAVIAVGAIVTVVAYRIMVGLGRLPEEARWFA